MVLSIRQHGQKRHFSNLVVVLARYTDKFLDDVRLLFARHPAAAHRRQVNRHADEGTELFAIWRGGHAYSVLSAQVKQLRGRHFILKNLDLNLMLFHLFLAV